jgi:hypothetical protein
LHFFSLRAKIYRLPNGEQFCSLLYLAKYLSSLYDGEWSVTKGEIFTCLLEIAQLNLVEIRKLTRCILKSFSGAALN